MPCSVLPSKRSYPPEQADFPTHCLFALHRRRPEASGTCGRSTQNLQGRILTNKKTLNHHSNWHHLHGLLAWKQSLPTPGKVCRPDQTVFPWKRRCRWNDTHTRKSLSKRVVKFGTTAVESKEREAWQRAGSARLESD